MNHCAVCGESGAQAWSAGTPEKSIHIGIAHDGECFALLWEAFWLEQTKAHAHSIETVTWKWQRRRAAVRGVPFEVPRPLSPVEEKLLEQIDRLGLEDLARELG